MQAPLAVPDELTRKGVALNLGASVYDPHDPVGKLLFNVLGMVAEFEADLIRARTREGMAVGKAKGRLRGKQPKLSKAQEAHLVSLHKGGVHHDRDCRTIRHRSIHGLPSHPTSNGDAAEVTMHCTAFSQGITPATRRLDTLRPARRPGSQRGISQR